MCYASTVTVRLPIVDRASAPAASATPAKAGKRRRRHPRWLKVPMPGGEGYRDVRRMVKELGLHTVCQSASCPNIGECWNNRALTIMILGDICTRSCRFCDVKTGRPLPVDEDEPRRVGAGSREGPYYRTERQTLLRLPRTRAVVFAIHTYVLARKDVPELG